jgi:hypothetical protein
MLSRLLCLIGRHDYSDEENRENGRYRRPRGQCARCREPVKGGWFCCYCPECGNGLPFTDSFLSDTDLVRYRCSWCGRETGWYFDCPGPFVVEDSGQPPQ